MNIGPILFITCAVCVAIAIYRVLISGKRERIRRPEVLAISEHAPMRSSGRIHWLGGSEFRKLITSDPEAVVFHLVDRIGLNDGCRLARQEVRGTLQQLRTMLAWIPTQSRIVVYRAYGIDSATARRLIAMAHGRELNLLSESIALPQVEGSVSAGGEAWQ